MTHAQTLRTIADLLDKKELPAPICVTLPPLLAASYMGCKANVQIREENLVAWIDGLAIPEPEWTAPAGGVPTHLHAKWPDEVFYARPFTLTCVASLGAEAAS